MSRSTATLIVLLTFLAGLFGYNYFAKPFGELGSNPVSPAATPAASAVSTSFEQLSTKQRVLLMIAAPVTVVDAEAAVDQARWVRQQGPGMVTLFGDKIATAAARKTIAELGSPTYHPLVAVDHEGGSVQRLNGDGFSILPSWQRLCLQSATQRQELLIQSAIELEEVGVDVVFGPVVDLTASGSALGTRTCHSTPELVAQRSQEYIQAFTNHRILPVIKHFPGIGSVRRDLHGADALIEASEDELLVYQYILSSFPELGVMTAHVGLESLDGEVCSLSLQCIQGLKNLFSKVVVFSDALEMDSAATVVVKEDAEQTTLTLAERSVLAAKAGNHVLVYGRDVNPQQLDEVVAALAEQYEADADLKVSVDQAAQRVFVLKELRK